MLDRRLLLAGATGALVAAAAPALPRFERRSRALDRLFPPAPRFETIATGIRWAEGPLWLGDALLFSDPPAGITRRWSPRDGMSVFLPAPPGLDPRRVREGGTNGLARDAGGRVLAAHSGLRAVIAVDPRTRAVTTLADRYHGKRLNSPNDLVVDGDGAILFTDPPYGLVDGDASTLKEQPYNGVYRVTPGGDVTLLDGTLSRPNGIALAHGRLYIAESNEAAPRIWCYDWANGRATNRRVFLDAKGWPGPGLPDGMKAAHGLLFCSAPGGIAIVDAQARVLGRIRHDRPIANVAFAPGAMYLAADDRILRVAMRV